MNSHATTGTLARLKFRRSFRREKLPASLINEVARSVMEELSVGEIEADVHLLPDFKG